MKNRLFIFLIIMSLVLSGCGDKDETNDLDSNDNLELNAEFYDLGISSDENESLSLNARNVWDITLIDGELYTAVGDFDNNTGPTSIWKYDFETLRWVDSGEVKQEAIIRFMNLNGENIAIGADPIGRPTYAEVYILKNNEWKTFAKIKNALHIFDAEYYNEAFYFSCGYESDDYPVVKYIPDKNEYINIPLYKNGTNVINALKESNDINYKRATDLFLINSKLFCSFSCSYKNGKTTIEFFEFKKDRFEFCQAFKSSGMQMSKSVKNQMLFNADASLADRCYISLGNLYQTNDFVEFSQIDIPNDACVTDLLVNKDNNINQLYVLAVHKKENKYKNTIYKLNQNNLSEVFSFEHDCSALSFVKNDNDIYRFRRRWTNINKCWKGFKN